MIRPVDYYLADKAKPTFYIFVYNQPRPPMVSPNRPDQILKADDWEEARRFARAFVPHTDLQYLRLSALSPQAGKNTAWETNSETYWNEGGRVMFEFHRMPAGAVKLFEKFSPPVAREKDPPRRKIDSRTFDEMARDLERERERQAAEAWYRLWHQGDWSPEQGKLHPVKDEPKKRKGGLEAYERDEISPDAGWIASRNEWLRNALDKIEEEGGKVELAPQTPGHFDIAKHKAVRSIDIFMSTATVYYVDPGRPSKTIDFGGREEQPRAYEREGSGWDFPLSSGRGWATFREWALRHKKPGADSAAFESLLEEYRSQHLDENADEASAALEQFGAEFAEKLEMGAIGASAGHQLEAQLVDKLDFKTEKEQIDEETRRRLEEVEPYIKELVSTGKISRDEAAGLLNLTPLVGKRLSQKARVALQSRITELEREVEKLKGPPPPPPTPQEKARAERRESAKGPLSSDEISLLYNTFVSIVSRRTKREPFPKEVDKFDDLVATLQRVRPPLKFVQARIQVENLARQISAVATSGRIVIRRGQARVDELLEKMLSRGLSPDEEEELRRLREGEEYTSTEVIEYPPARIKLVADSGPWKVPYPYDLGGYWDRDSAEVNRANWEKKGFSVRVVEDHGHPGEE